MIIHVVIQALVSYLKTQLVPLGHAVTLKLASQNHQDPFADTLSMNVIYPNTVLDQVNFVQMMCLKLMEPLVISDKHSVTGVHAEHIRINVSYFGVLQERSLITNATNKIEKERGMEIVATTE